MVMPLISASWKESVPMRLWGTLPVINTTGEESIYAVAMAVTRFVAPGPLVARQTPVFPVRRA